MSALAPTISWSKWRSHTLLALMSSAEYRRTDLFTKRAKLMADWATFATAPAAAGAVVSMRRKLS